MHLPPTQRTLVYTQTASQFFLTQAPALAICYDSATQGTCLGIKRVVAQQGDDPGNETYLWRGAVGLPVAHCHLIHLQFLCHIALQQAEIKTSLAQVVSKGFQLTRVGR